MYPKDNSEADKFSAGIIKLLHNEKTQPQIVKQLQGEGLPPQLVGRFKGGVESIALRMGIVASMIIMRMVMLVQDQAEGRKPHFKMLVAAINMTIKELAQMCRIIGIKVTPQDMQEASKIAGDLIEGGFSGEQQGQPMPQQGQAQPMQNMQQQKPGLVGGAM